MRLMLARATRERQTKPQPARQRQRQHAGENRSDPTDHVVREQHQNPGEAERDERHARDREPVGDGDQCPKTSGPRSGPPRVIAKTALELSAD